VSRSRAVKRCFFSTARLQTSRLRHHRRRHFEPHRIGEGVADHLAHQGAGVVDDHARLGAPRLPGPLHAGEKVAVRPVPAEPRLVPLERVALLWWGLGRG
jgi:hypothetical protein